MTEHEKLEPTELSLDGACAEMRAALDALPGSEWEWSEMQMEGGAPPKDMDELTELVARCYRESPDSLAVHGVWIPDGERWACHTGNGPNGAAMAKFITLARNWMPKFLDIIDGQR